MILAVHILYVKTIFQFFRLRFFQILETSLLKSILEKIEEKLCVVLKWNNNVIYINWDELNYFFHWCASFFILGIVSLFVIPVYLIIPFTQTAAFRSQGIRVQCINPACLRGFSNLHFILNSTNKTKTCKKTVLTDLLNVLKIVFL